MTDASKKPFPVRMDPAMKKAVDQHAVCMGTDRSDVVREAIRLGMSIKMMPEYYSAKLKGFDHEKIMSEIRKALRALSS